MTDQHGKDTAHVLGGAPCRAEEFARWNRVMLQKERAYLSSVMATQRAFMDEQESGAIMHDLKDIDGCLAALGDAGLLKVPETPRAEGPPVEMWPASEGPVPPSQR